MPESYNISPNTLFVRIKSPEKVLFEGNADAVSSINENGKFDVLAQHANFISIIRDYIIIHQKKGQTQEIKIEQGIMRVVANVVHIFLGIERIESLNS